MPGGGASGGRPPQLAALAGAGHSSAARQDAPSYLAPIRADLPPGRRLGCGAEGVRRYPRRGLDFARSCRRPQQETRHAYVALERSCLVWAAAAALAGTPASAQKPGGTLVQITQPEPPNLAPYISTSAPIGQVTAKVYDGLLEYGFDLKPKAEPRRKLGGCAGRQDGHLQAAQGREVSRRQALHVRRRAVHDHGGVEEGASARHQHLPRRHGGRDARRLHRGVQAQQRRALHAGGAVGLREPDAAEARLRPGRHQDPSQRQQPDRYRSRSSSSSGGAASSCASTRTRTTGARGCRISIASLSASSTTRRRAPRRSKRARRTWRASERCPTATPRSWRSCRPSR